MLHQLPDCLFDTTRVGLCEATKVEVKQLNQINRRWQDETHFDASFKKMHGKANRICGECVRELHDGYKRNDMNFSVVKGMQRLCSDCEDVYAAIMVPRRGRPKQHAQRIRKGVCNCLREQWDGAWLCVPCSDRYSDCIARAGHVLKETRLTPVDPTIPWADNCQQRFDDTVGSKFVCLCGKVEHHDSVEIISPYDQYFERPIGLWVCMFCDQVCSPRESFKFGSTFLTSERPGNTYWTLQGPTFR